MIGNTLKDFRKKNHLTQEKLAQELSVSRNTISKWESNVCDPDVENLKALCQFFHCNIEDLTDDSYVQVFNQQIKQEEKKSKKHISTKLTGKGIIILTAVEITFLICLYVASQNITSYKWMKLSDTEFNIYSNENSTGTDTEIEEWTETKEFIPFLHTYHLWIVFIVVVMDVIVNVVLIVRKRGQINEKGN